MVDVIQAYKGLQKEKTALEKSLRALSGSSNLDSAEKYSDLDGSLKEDSESVVKESIDESTKKLQHDDIKAEGTGLSICKVMYTYESRLYSFDS